VARDGAAGRILHQRHAGDIATRVGANEQIGRLLSSGVAANALNLTSIIFFAAAMAIYDLPLAVIGVGMSLANVLALKLIGEAGRISAAVLRSSKAAGRRDRQRGAQHRNPEGQRP